MCLFILNKSILWKNNLKTEKKIKECVKKKSLFSQASEVKQLKQLK